MVQIDIPSQDATFHWSLVIGHWFEVCCDGRGGACDVAKAIAIYKNINYNAISLTNHR
jgi:hypothetical protein